MMLVWVLSALPVSAGETDSLEQVLQKSAARYNGIEGFSGVFHQTVEIPLLGKKKDFHGVIRYRSPNMLRLDYDVPENGYILCDGGSFYIFLPDVDSTRVMKTVLDTDPRSFLTEFFLEEAREKYTPHLDSVDEDSYHLRFVPRETGTRLLRVEVRVDRETRLVRRVSYVDPSGSVTSYSIDEIDVGPQAADLFRFTLPAGLRLLDLSGESD